MEEIWCPTCFNLIDCIQTNIRPQLLSDFASAQVVLGLTPTLLSTIAPSVGEICMLSSNRPLLSVLLSLGGPSVFCFRTLEYDDPLSNLVRVQSLFNTRPMRKGGAKAFTISACEYLLALAAIANTMHAGWMLGIDTVISWKCQISCLPVVWACCSLVIHVTASGSWQFSNTMRAVYVASVDERGEKIRRSVFEWMVDEFTLCAVKEKRGFLAQLKQEYWPVLFANVLAQSGAFVLVFFGTLLFSSLLFIGTIDAVGVVCRYMVSTAICRLILMYELRGMAAVETGEDR